MNIILTIIGLAFGMIMKERAIKFENLDNMSLLFT
jgi:hypothetical protein